MSKTVLLFIFTALFFSCTKQKAYTEKNIVGKYDVSVVIKDSAGLTPTQIIGLHLVRQEYDFDTDSVTFINTSGSIKNTTKFAWNIKNDTLTIDKRVEQKFIYAVKDTADGFVLQGDKADIILSRK